MTRAPARVTMQRIAAGAVLWVALLSLPIVSPSLEAAEQTTPPLPTVETFFRNADMGAAKLSPSGKWLAIATSTKTSRIFLAVVEVGDDKRDAMESAGLHPEFVVYDGDGHGFLKVENRVEIYTRMEKFLVKNLQ